MTQKALTDAMDALAAELDRNDEEVLRRYEEHLRNTGYLPVQRGDVGSGNFGHAGRPGEVGGSAPDVYKNFAMMGEAQKLDPWGKPISNRWFKSLTNDEKSIIKEYTSGGLAEKINAELRQGSLTHPSIEILDSAINKSTIPSNVIVYREGTRDMFGTKRLQSMIGKIVTDLGYVSTAMFHKQDFEAKYNFEIRIPKGSTAAYINGHSKYDSEHELLLPRGSKFKVLSVHRYDIELELVQ